MVTIIKGKELASAIKGGAKKFATMREFFHTLAASALVHVDEHADACHLNSVFAVTPINAQKELIQWATDLGKVKFSVKEGFKFAAGKASEIEKAIRISPAEYKRETVKKDAVEETELRIIQAAIKKIVKMDDDGKETSGFALLQLYALEKKLQGTAPKPLEVQPVAQIVKAVPKAATVTNLPVAVKQLEKIAA